MASAITPLLPRALPSVHTSASYRTALSALAFTAFAFALFATRTHHGLVEDWLSESMVSFDANVADKVAFDAKANSKFGAAKCGNVKPGAYDVRATPDLCFQCETALEGTFRSRCTVDGAQKCLSGTSAMVLETVKCDSATTKEQVPNWSHTKDGLIHFKATQCLGSRAKAKTKVAGDTDGRHGSLHYPMLKACSASDADMKWSIEASSGLVEHLATHKCLTYLPAEDQLMLRSCDQLSGGLAQAFDLYGIVDAPAPVGSNSHSKVTALAIPEDIDITDKLLNGLKEKAMAKLRVKLKEQLKAKVAGISDDDVKEICPPCRGV
jgi:hypothetical protein